MSGGSFTIFVERPISMALISVFAILVIGQAAVTFRSRKKTTS